MSSQEARDAGSWYLTRAGELYSSVGNDLTITVNVVLYDRLANQIAGQAAMSVVGRSRDAW